jgi:hypothetical protein
MNRLIAGVVCCLLSCGPGCNARHAAQHVLRPPSISGQMVNVQAESLSLAYPASWVAVPSNDYRLLLAPGATEAQLASISLDIPSLPPHLPGMIPAGLVRNGYLDDLRRQAGPTFKLGKETSRSAGGVTGTQMDSSWQAKGHRYTQSALILVHADHVYILRATADAAHQSQTQAAFESIIGSFRWAN